MLWLTCRIFKWNFDHFLWETGWNVKESRLMCGSRTRLTCSILITLFPLINFRLYWCKKLYKIVARKCVSYEILHFMQFSVATCESCMLHCVLLDCNGTKWTGNTLIIPAAACSQQPLRRNKIPTGCFLFSFLVFSCHDMNVFVTDWL